MNRIFNLVKYDYLQRVRSYQFLIISCASLAFAYILIPAPGDKYSTVRIGEYLGYYNSSWIAYVTAIMTSVFIGLMGYYVINNSIKIDQITRLGQINAATSISNFQYLIAKFLTNFLILTTIVFFTFLVSILLFFMYSSGYPFELGPFIMAYLLIPIPSVFFIAALAVLLEVIFPTKSVLQNIAFFILFMVTLVHGSKFGLEGDLFGVSYPTQAMEQQVNRINIEPEKQELNIGFIIDGKILKKRFEFTGVKPNLIYTLFRFLWVGAGLALIFISSKFFHRFELKERRSISDKNVARESEKESLEMGEFDLSTFPTLDKTTSIGPVFKAELLMMIRKGKKWLWGLNLIGMVLLTFLPLEPAHKIVLPILWFLQVHRWADLVTKEKTHQMHYFIFSSFKPVQRLLTSQWLAAITIAVGLALPLLVRYLFMGEVLIVAAILTGAIFIIFFSSLIGIVTGGKRLFEILFFFIAYMNVNGLPYTDYFGGVNQSPEYLLLLGGITLILGVSSLLLRKLELNRV